MWKFQSNRIILKIGYVEVTQGGHITFKIKKFRYFKSKALKCKKFGNTFKVGNVPLQVCLKKKCVRNNALLLTHDK